MDRNIVETELHVGYVLLKDLPSTVLAQLTFKLAQTDQVRLETFLRFEDKIAFAAGRRLVQKLLSDFVPEPRGGWRIEVKHSGKPALLHSQQLPDLRFNITHCSRLVAAVVAVGRDVGIDAELVSDAIDHLEIAQKHLPSVELTFLDSLNGSRRRDAFFSLWTLREAYLKATGEGLTNQSPELNFTLAPPAVFSDSSRTQHLPQWFLWHDKLTSKHILSVAAHRSPDEVLVCHPKLFDIDNLYR